jgi:hypothetical protein
MQAVQARQSVTPIRRHGRGCRDHGPNHRLVSGIAIRQSLAQQRVQSRGIERLGPQGRADLVEQGLGIEGPTIRRESLALQGQPKNLAIGLGQRVGSPGDHLYRVGRWSRPEPKVASDHNNQDQIKR